MLQCGCKSGEPPSTMFNSCVDTVSTLEVRCSAPWSGCSGAVWLPLDCLVDEHMDFSPAGLSVEKLKSNARNYATDIHFVRMIKADGFSDLLAFPQASTSWSKISLVFWKCDQQHLYWHSWFSDNESQWSLAMRTTIHLHSFSTVHYVK